MKLVKLLGVISEALLFICYGATMVLVIEQYKMVGAGPTIFRFIAWQIVLVVLIFQKYKQP